MSRENNPDPIVIALQMDDAALADRLAGLLADVPSVRLAAAGETADVVLSLPDSPEPAEEEAPLTARELEVLALMAEARPTKS